MKAYILYNPKSGKYIQLDQASGGYPYEVNNWYNARFFAKRDRADEYCKIMQKDWLIYEINPIISESQF